MPRELELLPIGTIVTADDGYTLRIGQIADHTRDRWGRHHLVAIDGELRSVDYIGPAAMLGIGWKIATPAEIARAKRHRDAAAREAAE